MGMGIPFSVGVGGRLKTGFQTAFGLGTGSDAVKGGFFAADGSHFAVGDEDAEAVFGIPFAMKADADGDAAVFVSGEDVDADGTD